MRCGIELSQFLRFFLPTVTLLMLGESICHLRGVRSIFVDFILFLMEDPVSKQCRV